MDSKVTEYVELFEATKLKVSNEEIAMALAEQIGKDRRVEAMTNRYGGQRSNGDQPATKELREYLKEIRYTGNADCLTREQASKIIQDYLDNLDLS